MPHIDLIHIFLDILPYLFYFHRHFIVFPLKLLLFKYVFVVIPIYISYILNTWFVVFAMSIWGKSSSYFLNFQNVFVRLAKEFERNCRGEEAVSHLSLQKSLIPTIEWWSQKSIYFSQERTPFVNDNDANTSWLQKVLFFKQEQENIHWHWHIQGPEYVN